MSPPPDDRRTRRHLVGWLLVGAAVLAALGLALLVFTGESEPRKFVPDAKDNPNFGPVTTLPSVGDAKDNPNYGPVVVAPEPGTGDAKDHVGYGSAPATCRELSTPTSRYCPSPAG